MQMTCQSELKSLKVFCTQLLILTVWSFVPTSSSSSSSSFCFGFSVVVVVVVVVVVDGGGGGVCVSTNR